MSACNPTLGLKHPKTSANFVLIVADGGDSLQVKRNALMEASSVFSILLKDSHTSRIEVNDEKEIFEPFLEYINTGHVKESVMQLYGTDLLYLANKYHLHALKNDCQEWLSLRITPISVSYLLDLAISLEAKKLKIKCIEFLNKFASAE